MIIMRVGVYESKKDDGDRIGGITGKWKGWW